MSDLRYRPKRKAVGSDQVYARTNLDLEALSLAGKPDQDYALRRKSTGYECA